MGWELRDDALSSESDGFALRVGLPWMRSLPLACVLELGVTIDRHPIPDGQLQVRLGPERLSLDALTGSTGWWFLQDRLVLTGPLALAPDSEHGVTVFMRLLLPYLTAGPGRPAVLPFHLSRRLRVDMPTVPGVFRDVA
jgi:hypothetical protein